MSKLLLAITSHVAVLTLLAALLIPLSGAARADQPAAVELTASPGIILADGKSTTTIAAVCTLPGGRPIPDGTPINFSASSGTLSDLSITSAAGLARVTLTSSPIAGKAVITATYIANGAGMAGTVMVEFTVDHSVANSDQGDQDWIHVTSRGYLAYGADDQTIDSYGKQQGVRFQYRGVTIDADALQVDLATNVVKARNAVVRRDSQTIVNADEVQYQYLVRDGTAVVTDGPGSDTIESVHFSGIDLHTEIEKKPSHTGDAYEFIDLSDDRVLVTAQSVAVKPGETIQLRRASIFLDGKKMISLPFHVMPLTTNQLFGQQILGFGTDGFYLNVPYYLGMTSHDSTAVYLRSSAASQEAGTFTTNGSGYSLDFDHEYTLPGSKGTGGFQVNGLSAKQPEFRWHQTEIFGGNTHGYFYVDSPSRQSLYSSANLSRQFQWFSANIATTYSKTVGVASYSLTDNRTTTYFETKPKAVGGQPGRAISYVADITLTDGDHKQRFGTTPLVDTPFSTRTASVRFFTPTYNATRTMTVTNAVNFGESYDVMSHISGLSMTATSALNFRLSKVTTAALNYNFVHDPLREGTVISTTGLLSQALINTHQLGLSFFTGSPTNVWDAALTSNFLFPASDFSLTGSFDYRVAGWHFGMSQLISRTSGFFYKDLEFSTARKIGQREVSVAWSTLDHQIRINMDSAQF